LCPDVANKPKTGKNGYDATKKKPLFEFEWGKYARFLSNFFDEGHCTFG
jgi:hypothetical protein